jgi:hypothetical protein
LIAKIIKTICVHLCLSVDNKFSYLIYERYSTDLR